MICGHCKAYGPKVTVDHVRTCSKVTSQERYPFPPTKPAYPPDGMYALVNKAGYISFYQVETGQSERWKGFHFLSLLTGSPGAWRKDPVYKTTALYGQIMEYLAANTQDCARLFGLKAGRCGQCGSPLSNVRSRAAGYGQDCANNNGWWYPSEKEAKRLLGEEA